MKKLNLILLFLILIPLTSVLLSGVSLADITLPYSTTFNCPEQVLIGNVYNCDGLINVGGADSSGHYPSITTDANFPNGGGVRGARFWVGLNKNDYASAFVYQFPPVSEIWVRGYVSYEPGMIFTQGQKLAYFINGLYIVIAGNYLRITDVDTYNYYNNVNGTMGLQYFYGGPGFHTAADGSWHCIEFHWKAQNPSTASNGQFDIWIDSTQYMHYDTIHFGAMTQPGFTMTSNNDPVDNPTDQWEDWDDIAVSATGRLGCPYTLGAAGPSPNPPTNLKAQ